VQHVGGMQDFVQF